MARKDNHPNLPKTKVLFVDIDPTTGRPTAVPYVPVRDLPRARKFLYWSEDAPNAPVIIAVGSTHLLSHEMVRLAAMRSEERLAGAGAISDSQVESWKSSGYQLETPPNLRPSILAALGLNK